jgi:hypothetical protein
MISTEAAMPPGVYPHGNKYKAMAGDRYLGLFPSLESAVNARVAAGSGAARSVGDNDYRVDGSTSAAISAYHWSDNGSGYLRTGRGQRRGSKQYLHQIAWKMYGGQCPAPGERIDHINGDKRDNRSCNLRLISHAGNCLNQSRASNVYPAGKRWSVRIARTNGTSFCGCYETEEIARLVARHVKQKWIELEVVQYLKESDDGNL